MRLLFCFRRCRTGSEIADDKDAEYVENDGGNEGTEDVMESGLEDLETAELTPVNVGDGETDPEAGDGDSGELIPAETGDIAEENIDETPPPSYEEVVTDVPEDTVDDTPEEVAESPLEVNAQKKPQLSVAEMDKAEISEGLSNKAPDRSTDVVDVPQNVPSIVGNSINETPAETSASRNDLDIVPVPVPVPPPSYESIQEKLRDLPEPTTKVDFDPDRPPLDYLSPPVPNNIDEEKLNEALINELDIFSRK